MRECLRLAVAEAVGITGLIVWCRHVERLPRSRDVLGAPAVGEETVVPDAVETVGQDVDQKAADELVDGERHRLGPLTPAGAARDRRRDLGIGLSTLVRWLGRSHSALDFTSPAQFEKTVAV
jgi:hypothetical protein